MHPIFKRLLPLLALLCLLCQAPAGRAEGFREDLAGINQAAQSVLMLYVYDAEKNLVSTGSGFVAFDNRTLVTNYHVMAGADSILATSDDGYDYL